MITLRPIPMTNKINNLKILITVTLFSFFQNCQSQTAENPKSLGSEIFKLENITFKENVDTLFSKIPFVKLDRTNDTSKAIIYRNKIDDNKKVEIVDFYGKNSQRLSVTTNAKNEIQAFSTYIDTKENPQNLINKLDKQFKSYKVNLKPNKKFEFSKAKAYQWNLPDKIYAVTISDLGNEYTISIIVAKNNVDKNILSVDKTPICLDNTCKE